MNTRSDAGACGSFCDGRHQPHPSEASRTAYATARTLAMQTERVLAAGRLKPADINQDSAVLAKLIRADVLKPGEKLGEFYGRVGLGREQILSMPVEEICGFCELAAQREPEPAPPFAFEEKQPPQPRWKTLLYRG